MRTKCQCRHHLWFRRDGWWICPNCEKQKERIDVGFPVTAAARYCRSCDIIVGTGHDSPEAHRH